MTRIQRLDTTRMDRLTCGAKSMAVVGGVCILYVVSALEGTNRRLEKTVLSNKTNAHD
jgi:hypothetical protein